MSYEYIPHPTQQHTYYEVPVDQTYGPVAHEQYTVMEIGQENQYVQQYIPHYGWVNVDAHHNTNHIVNVPGNESAPFHEEVLVSVPVPSNPSRKRAAPGYELQGEHQQYHQPIKHHKVDHEQIVYIEHQQYYEHSGQELQQHHQPIENHVVLHEYIVHDQHQEQPELQQNQQHHQLIELQEVHDQHQQYREQELQQHQQQHQVHELREVHNQDQVLPLARDEPTYLDTFVLGRRLVKKLQTLKIKQNKFAEIVLSRSQGSLSEMLRKPKPWEEIKSSKGSYERINAFLKLSDAQMRVVADMKPKEAQAAIGFEEAKKSVKPAKTTKRPVFTAHQQATLDQLYEEVQCPDEGFFRSVADSLGLSADTVKNFFNSSRRRAEAVRRRRMQ